MEKFIKKNIGIWHKLDLKKLKPLRRKIIKISLNKFINNLKNIGYCVEYSNSRQLKKIIKVFQMKFRPELVDGKLDVECYEIAKSLNNL